EITRVSILMRVKDPTDQSAWAAFDAIYRPMLIRYARARGLSDADAEDVVQHCLATLVQHVHSFEYDPAKGRFRSWLRTLVNNQARNQARKKSPRAAESAVLRAAPDPADPPDEVFDRIWMQEHLRHCLDNLRKELRPAEYEAFRGHALDGA